MNQKGLFIEKVFFNIFRIYRSLYYFYGLAKGFLYFLALRAK
jgi:hypothetical protein